MDTTRTRPRPDDGAEPAEAEASVMAASPVRCGFCLSERGKKDKYRSLHPSVPQSLLEEDTPPLVCTPCYNFLYSEFARKCGDDRAASDSESDEETGQKALKRRYPNALSANNGLPPAKRLYMLLMAKLFTKSAKLPSLSVDRFSLKGIPFTSDRSFAFDLRKVTFGVRQGAMGENGQSPVASVEGRLPWLTSLLTKNGVQPDTADVAVRKRSRLSWCNPKKPCVYCLNHIDAVASGLSRGTRRKSCVCMPASWKSIDEKTRSEARDAAFSALDCNAVSPLVPAPGLDSEEGASTPPRSPTQESSGKTWQENCGDSDRESEMALEAVKKVRIKNEADDGDMGHQAGGTEPDSSSGSKNVVDGVSRPAKRLRSLLRGDQKPRAVEESAAAIDERSDAAEPDEGDGDEANEKATAGGGNAAVRNDAEAQGKPAKMVRKRRRGLSAELRSLQLWSHWEEEEEDSTNDNENGESENKKEERKRKKRKENEKWDEEEEEEPQYRRGKLRRSAKSSDTEAKKDEQPRRARWAKRDSESEEAEQKRTPKRKVDEKLDKKEREKEEEARKERRESELRRSLRSRVEREKARLEREAALRAEEAKRKLEQERREREKKKRDQKRKDKAKIEEEKEEEEEEEMKRGRKEEEKRRDKRKKSTSQLKTATSTSNGPPKEEDTAVAALLSLVSENAAPKTPAALPALDEATVQTLSASMSSRTSLATSVQFEEIVLDDDEDNDNADDRHRLRKAAKPGNVAAVAAPRQTHLPSLATLFLGSSLPQSSIAGVPALPPSLPHVPLPPSPSGLRASSPVAAKPPSQAPHRASPRPSTPPSPTPTSAPVTQSTAHYSGVGQALPPAPPGYPYAAAVANAARAMPPQHAYAAQLTAAQMAHINPQMLLQLLQSLHYPSGSQAAAAHAAQALMYAPLLNLPPGAAAQFRPPPTSSYPSAPPAPPAANTRTHQAAPPRTWPPPNHHK